MPGKMARSDPRPSVQVTRGVDSGQHLASVLQEGRENANIDAGLGFIWRISVQTVEGAIAMVTTRVDAGRAISSTTAAPARAAVYGRGRARLRPLLASTSLAALLIGAGSPAAFAQCALQPTTNQLSVDNSTSINCIAISGITVTGNVTNHSGGVITAPGGGGVLDNGINI